MGAETAPLRREWWVAPSRLGCQAVRPNSLIESELIMSLSISDKPRVPILVVPLFARSDTRQGIVAPITRRTSDVREYIRLMSDHVLTDGVVVLKPLAPEDASEWLAGEDEEQLRWFEAPRPAQISDVEEFIFSCRESWRTLGGHRHWGIRRIDSHPLLGGVDLRALGNDEVNLSYVVFPHYRRQGFARRASLLALSYAAETMGAKAVIIRMLPGNVSSSNLALALGANYIGDEPSEGGETFQVFRRSLQPD